MNIVIFITCAKQEEAQKIATALVEAKLAACVNIVKGLKSIFWWEEKIDCCEEILLIAKSQHSLMPEIIKQVKSLHSYQVPEVIALPIVSGNEDYLNWINESIRKSC